MDINTMYNMGTDIGASIDISTNIGFEYGYIPY